MLQIVEKFISIGGEAPIIGYPMYLIRFSQCNLACTYCDTQYNSEVNIEMDKDTLIDDITNALHGYPSLKIMFTGGEPLIPERQDDLCKITGKLHSYEFYIETNGSVPITNELHDNTHLIVDWKSPSSGHDLDFCLENLNKLRPDKDCIKFVINKDDLNWLLEKVSYAAKHYPEIPLFISPRWNEVNYKDLVSFILEHKLPASLSFQLHKHVWDEHTRGV